MVRLYSWQVGVRNNGNTGWGKWWVCAACAATLCSSSGSGRGCQHSVLALPAGLLAGLVGGSGPLQAARQQYEAVAAAIKCRP